MPAKYRAGELIIPGGTGNVFVPLPFAPDAVAFIGGNGSAKDTVLTGANLGVFMGLMGRDYADASLKAYSVSVLPEQGARVRVGYPICQAATCNTEQFAASAVSLDPNGFTVNFTSVGAGVIYWLAFKADNAGYLESTYGGAGTISLGTWIPKTSLIVGYRAGGDMLAGDVFCDLHHAAFGGGSWHGQPDGNGMGGFVDVIRGNLGRHETNAYANPSGIPYGYVLESADYIGPFLTTSFGVGSPTGAGRTDYTYSNGNQCRADRLLLEIEGVQGFMAPPDGAGNFSDVDLSYNPFIERADAVVGMTVADTSNDKNGVAAMLGFSFACRQDGGVFNCGVFADGVAGTLYQSSDDMVFDTDGAGAAITGRIDFDAPALAHMRLTTEVDTVSGGGPGMVFHAYGREAPPVMWIPEFNRRKATA